MERDADLAPAASRLSAWLVIGVSVAMLFCSATSPSMTKHEFLARYGKSAYEERLELANGFYLQGKSAKESFQLADQFIEFLKTQDEQ